MEILTTVRVVGLQEIDTITNPVARALVLGDSTTPPRLIYPSTSIVLRLGCPIGEEWVPQFDNNSELVEEYV